MRMVVTLGSNGPVEICEQNAGGPNPFLLAVGELRIGARCGQAAVGLGTTESSSVSVTLDRRARKMAALFDHPLRALVDIYDNRDALYFSGTVSSIEYGNDLTWEVDA